MATISAPVAVARVFISCPGDLALQRGLVSQALATLNQDPEFAGRVALVPYAYENVVPARSGMDAQEVVNSYMLRPEDADLVVCMFWRRMGTPLERVLNPATNTPYQSGSEFEYLSAYAAAQRQPTPLVLLYRCHQPAPDAGTAEERTQLDRVNQFFARFASGGDLRGLVGGFTSDEELVATIQRDVAQLLRGDLLPLLARRGSQPTDRPVVFGLPALPAGYVERPESLDALRKALIGSRSQIGVVAATALYGQGGLGKTVLARAICEDASVRAVFTDGMLWATVGQHPDIARIQREWIRVLGGDIVLASSMESGCAELTRLIGDRAMLLVLDDVWQAEAAAALAVAGPRCRTLITTRDAAQVEGATRVSLDLMTPAQCRQTLRDTARGRAFDDATSSDAMLDDAPLDAIAQRLGRLPLALKVVGGLLAHGLTWPEIARELDEGHLPDIAIGNSSIFAALDVSVRLLPDGQRERYRELVVFPKDEPLNAATVARLWAQTSGLSAFTTKRLLAEFRDRSLIQANNTLHDLQMDYLHAIMELEQVRTLHSALCDAYAASGTLGDASPWSELPDDDGQYGWRFIATHLSMAGRTRDLEVLLTDVTWLQGKLARLGPLALVADFLLWPGSEPEPAGLVASAVMAGGVTLASDPGELLNQIRGRVGPVERLHHLPERPRPYFELYTQSLLPFDSAFAGVISGFVGIVNDCAFSPDGTQVLVALQDTTLLLIERASGRVLHRYQGDSNVVLSCAFSPDGTLALSASGRTLHLWDVATGQERRQLKGDFNVVWDCAFSPDGTLIVGACHDMARLWEVETGRELHRFEGHALDYWVQSCAFNPDGTLVLSGTVWGWLRLWEVASGHELRRLGDSLDWNSMPGRVTSCAFSPDGTLALSASGHLVHLWDVERGQELRQLKGHTGDVNDCAFSPNGTLALSASEDRTVRLWDVASGQELRRFEGHTDGVESCTFSPDGQVVVSTSRDSTVRFWNVASEWQERHFAGHTSSVKHCAFSPDGTLALSASGDHTLRLWDVERGQELRQLKGHTAAVNRCVFSPDGQRVLSTASDITLRIWDVASGQELRRFEGTLLGECEAFSPDGTLALSRVQGGFALRLWDVASGQELRRFEGHSNSIYKCAFSPDGRRVLSISFDQTMRLWDVATGQELHCLKADIGVGDGGCAFSPDGTLALSSCGDRTLHLWDVATGQERRRLEGHTAEVNDCTFSQDGTLALSASKDKTVRLWEVATGTTRAIWRSDANPLCCAFHPQGDCVAVGDSAGGMNMLKIIGLERSHPVAPVPVLTTAATAMSLVGGISDEEPAVKTSMTDAPTPDPTPPQSQQVTIASQLEPSPKPRRKRFWFF